MDIIRLIDSLHLALHCPIVPFDSVFTLGLFTRKRAHLDTILTNGRLMDPYPNKIDSLQPFRLLRAGACTVHTSLAHRQLNGVDAVHIRSSFLHYYCTLDVTCYRLRIIYFYFK